jgi:hypothetical protein
LGLGLGQTEPQPDTMGTQRVRSRPDLTLPLRQQDLTSVAVPLTPPSSVPSTSSSWPGASQRAPTSPNSAGSMPPLRHR